MTPRNPEQPSAPTTHRVVVVDDHPVVREGLAHLIQAEPDLIVCGQAEDRGQALAVIRATQPNLAIVDLSLKNSHGLELVKDIRAQHPDVLILVVSMYDESLYAERAISAGARGYLTKQEATRNVVVAIRRILAGEIYVSESLAGKILGKLAGQPRPEITLSLDLLSDRELEVLQYIGNGHNARQIADCLHIDPKTVETYRSRIKEKLQLKDSTELLQTAIRWVHSGQQPQAGAGA
jgi:DNA-binding NarL/FixJ family response regulator